MSSDGTVTPVLPTEFDLAAIDAYLKSRALSDSNRTKCMGVILNLVTGRGVTHKNKSGVFLQGRCVTPHDDLEALRTDGSERVVAVHQRSKLPGHIPWMVPEPPDPETHRVQEPSTWD